MTDASLTSKEKVSYCGGSMPGLSKSVWDFIPCTHRATHKVLVAATGGYVYRCGIHARRYKNSPGFTVEKLR